MTEQDELLQELQTKFSEAKTELGFSPTLDELENAFSISDSILSTGFVSDKFSRQLCSRIVDVFMGWHGYLNNLLVPNASFMASQTESKLFHSSEDREKIWKMIKKIMEFSSSHSLNGLRPDKEAEKEFINSSFQYWKESFSPALQGILERVNQGWKKS